MRSFLTRLVGSSARVVLLAPCLLLLICSACVTSFPLDNLKVDMTMVQATEAFGEPISTSTQELSEAVTLLQKENDRIYERLESAVGLSETRGLVAQELEESSTETLHSLERFVAELDEASGEQGVRSTWVYSHEEFGWMAGNVIERWAVELLFEGNKLVSWEMRPDPFPPTTGMYVYRDPFPSPMFFHHSKKDTEHHKKGHEHHHPDC